MAEARRYGIAVRLQAERVLRTHIVACYTTDNPDVVKCEMPNHSFRYVNIVANLEVGGQNERTPDKPVVTYMQPEQPKAPAPEKAVVKKKKTKTSK